MSKEENIKLLLIPGLVNLKLQDVKF